MARGRNNFGTALARGQLSGAGSETRSFIAMGPPALAMGRFGVRPYGGQGLGGQTHRDAHGCVPSVGAAGTGTAGDGNGLAQARLRLAARRPPGSPSRHRQARIRLGWVLAVGCRRVSPIIVPFTGPPALLAPTGASPACASSPRAGVRRLWAVQGGGGGMRGAPERHGGGHAGVSGLCPGCIGVFQAAKRGCNQRGHGFHQGVSLGAHQRVPGGQTGDSVGSLGCAEWGAERNNQGDPGATQGGAKGSQYGV